MNKILYYLLVFSLLGLLGCDYKPVLSKKNYEFSINVKEISGDEKINSIIVNNFNNLKGDEKKYYINSVKEWKIMINNKLIEATAAFKKLDKVAQAIYRKKQMMDNVKREFQVAKTIGCGKSALNQNPALKEALLALEDKLRDKGVLPPLTESAKKDADKPKQYDNTANRKLLDSKRVSALEAENIELKAKVKELESKLERFGELNETLSEMGFMPR